MMGSVTPKTCWASYKYRIIKLWYIVAPCLIFFLWIIQEYQTHKMSGTARQTRQCHTPKAFSLGMYIFV
jgi:hypothetical protein